MSAAHPLRERRAEMLEDLRACVPHELRELAAWVLFRLVPKPGKPGKFDKVPHYAGTLGQRFGAAGSPGDLERLADFPAALVVLDSPQGARFDGLGLAVLPCHDFLALDLDEVDASPERRQFADLVRACGAYVETSPSGRGLRAFFRGKTGLGNRKNHCAGVELFESAGFVTVTGAEVSDRADLVPMPPEVRERLEAILGSTPGKTVTRADAPATVERPKLPELLERRLAAGFPDDCRDRSAHLYGLALRLRRAGLEAPQALTILADPAGPWAAPALERRGGDVASARDWLWRYVVAPAWAAEIDEPRAAELAPDDLPPVAPPEAYDDAGGNCRGAARNDEGEAREPSILAGPEAAAIRPDLFDAPPDAPRMVIEGFEPLDVGVVPGAGGTGKTTFELWLAIHRILGRPVFGREILRPGPVLYVSAEDSRERIEWRVYQLCKALNLSRDARRLLLAGLYVEDLSARRWRLVQADQYGNLTATALADRLAELYAGRGLSSAVCDPMVYFGPGERFVNDGEAELMLAGRSLSRALECSVRFPHHTGKAQAREDKSDQYAGRGGSAGADNARFVHVLTVHGTESSFAEPAGVTLQDMTAGNILRLHIAKLTDAKRPAAPFWIRREGWRFDWIVPREDDPAEREAAALRELCEFVRRAAESGVRHTSRSLEAAFEPGDCIKSRKDLRKLLHVALERGHLVERELPQTERKGGKTYYLTVGSTP